MFVSDYLVLIISIFEVLHVGYIVLLKSSLKLRRAAMFIQSTDFDLMLFPLLFLLWLYKFPLFLSFLFHFVAAAAAAAAAASSYPFTFRSNLAVI